MTTALPKSHNDERMAITLSAGNQAASTSAAPTDLGDNTPAGWFPNLGVTKLNRGTQFKIVATTAADRDLLAGAADGQEFGLVVTARSFDNGDPATGNVVQEESDSPIFTKDAADNKEWDPTQSMVAKLPMSFDAEEINIQVVIPNTGGSQPTGLKIYAL